MSKRIKNDIHFVTKCSFRHFFVSSSNQKLLLHKVLVFSSIRNMCQKRTKNDIFCLIIKSKKLLLQKFFLFLSNRKYVKKGLKMTFIRSKSVYFVTFLPNHRIKKLILQKVFVLSNKKKFLIQ